MAGKLEYIPREISWLSFNERVLQEAEDERNPLIERLRFLGIFSNNQDEYFRVRVADLRRLSNIKRDAKKALGRSPNDMLEEIQERVIAFQKRFEKTYQLILKELKNHNIHIVNESQVTEHQKLFVEEYFHDHIRSSLVPIMLSQTEQFPYLKDKYIYLAVKLHLKNEKHDSVEYALIEVPSDVIKRFLVLPNNEKAKCITLLDDVIRVCLNDIFKTFEYTKIEAYTIKLTRDAELDIDNDISKSLLEKVSSSLDKRKVGNPVRFVYDKDIPEDLLEYIMKKMKLTKKDALIPGGRYHNFKDFMSFPNIGSNSLEFNKLTPQEHPILKKSKSTFDTLDQQDILLNYPYQSFQHFIDFLREVAIDPKVKSLKITLYRVSQNRSKVINALISAAQNGKSVTAVVELRARFDEKINIELSNQLEDAGVKVIFGVPGLKVHSKICLVSRRFGNKERHYACIGTGNFNEDTAKVYTDKLLLTADQSISEEVDKVFKFFKNNYKRYKFKHLMLSPFQFRNRLVQLINKEIRTAKSGKVAYIIIKVNSVTDQDIVRKLYAASQAGVNIQLLVRGECSLVAGVKGLSENINVISIVGRYLEHSRILIFSNNSNPLYYITSANLMYKNMDNRVEVTCPVYDPNIQKQILDQINLQLDDAVKSRIIDAKQQNKYKNPDKPSKPSSQVLIHRYFSNLNKQNEDS